MKIYFKAPFLSVLLLAVSCSGGSSNLSGNAKSGSNNPEKHKAINEEVSPLMALCQNIDYSDTTLLHDNAAMKERMVEIVKLLPVTDSLSTRRALSRFFRGISYDERSVATADSLGELYLNNPASPVRDEELFIRFLSAMLSVESIPEATKLRGEEKLRTALLNRTGTIANDFRFIDRQGNTNTLLSIAKNSRATEGLHDSSSTPDNADRESSSIKGDNPLTLLIFYDPECPHCGDILNIIADDPNINSLATSGEMTVLAIYAEGKRTVWEKTKYELPSNWIVGYDLTGILDKDLYDLPAMPTLYLLDSDSRVIMKDPDPRALLEFVRLKV